MFLSFHAISDLELSAINSLIQYSYRHISVTQAVLITQPPNVMQLVMWRTELYDSRSTITSR